MGRLVINNAMTVNGAFEAPVPEPDGWLVLDADGNQVSLEQFLVADAMVLGRKTYEGLAAVWPQLADDPTLGLFADQMNSMPKYVASRTLHEPVGVERHPAGRRPGHECERPQGPPRQDPGRRRRRRADARPHHPGSRGRVLVLGEPVAVAGRAADLRWRWAGPPGVDRLDDVWLWGRAAGLPAGTRPAGLEVCSLNSLRHGERPQEDLLRNADVDGGYSA